MGISVVTFADLGKKTNLKTVDILPVIEGLIHENILDGIFCRTNRDFDFSKTHTVVPFWLRIVMKLIELGSFKLFSARTMEELYFDRAMTKVSWDTDLILFHPEYFFHQAVDHAKRQGKITVGIATMAHTAFNAKLEEEEQHQLGIPVTDTYYQKLLARGAGGVPAFDYVIAVSDFVKKTYIDQGFPEDRIFVANLDTNITVTNSHEPSHIFRVVYTAHTNLLKGLQYLLDAWEQLDEIPNKELIIIGSIKKSPKQWYVRCMQKIKKNPSIKWVGHVSREQLGKYYRSAATFVFPSLTEGNPRVILEAMAHELPVITTVNARGLVQDGVSGFVIPIRDAEFLAKKLKFLYGNSAIAEHMGEAARKVIEHETSFSTTVIALCKKILTHHL